MEALNDVNIFLHKQLTQLTHYLPLETFKDPYHSAVIRERLNRRLDDVLPSMMDELRIVCDELLPPKQGGELPSCFLRIQHSQTAYRSGSASREEGHSRHCRKSGVSHFCRSALL